MANQLEHPSIALNDISNTSSCGCSSPGFLTVTGCTSSHDTAIEAPQHDQGFGHLLAHMHGQPDWTCNLQALSFAASSSQLTAISADGADGAVKPSSII